MATNSALKANVSFFNSKLTYVNNQRLQINRSKGVAKYLVNSQTNLRDINWLDTSLGVLSFSLYVLRFTANTVLLAELILKDQQALEDKKCIELYYSLLNDSLWCAVNLSQFFWLSFKNSEKVGLYGIQLEVMAQFIDLTVMIVRFYQAKIEFDLKFSQASAYEQKLMQIAQQHKEIQFIRSLITALGVSLIMGLFAFSVISIPISPILYSFVLLSSVLRILTDINRDRTIIQELYSQAVDQQEISKEKERLTAERQEDLNQVILYSVLFPVGLCVLLTASSFLSCSLGLSLICGLGIYLANTHFAFFADLEQESSNLNPSFLC